MAGISKSDRFTESFSNNFGDHVRLADYITDAAPAAETASTSGAAVAMSLAKASAVATSAMKGGSLPKFDNQLSALYYANSSRSVVASGGADTFMFDTAIGRDVDTIQNIAVKQDFLELDHTIFAGTGTSGTLGDALLAIGTEATSASTRIIDDSGTGDLLHDADVTGSKAAVLFPHLDAGFALTASNVKIG